MPIRRSRLDIDHNTAGMHGDRGYTPGAIDSIGAITTHESALMAPVGIVGNTMERVLAIRTDRRI